MPPEEEVLLQITKVHFSFRDGRSVRRVLEDVDFSVRDGEVTAIIGRSGVGKSTLLRIMAGQLSPHAGSTRLAEAEASRLGTLYHPQEALLLPWANVLENAQTGLHLLKLTATMDVAALFSTLDLSGLEARYPARLSGGQIERVALARTLLTPARVYLLDEPLSGTDYPQRVEIEEFLVALANERRIAAIVVTHDVPQAVAISVRIQLLASEGTSARARTIELPAELRDLGPTARRAHPAFGPFVQSLSAELGAGG
jgi:NitT/TauT family transport system ATP-binding protein